MKKLLAACLAMVLTVGAIAFSANNPGKIVQGDLAIEVEGRNPWTNLNVDPDPSAFHFAIVSDRTGGHRPRIFSQAVEQINLMQPAFVVSVGDLIEGYSKDQKKLAKEWKEFQGYAHKLSMPFFYVPGNHDVSNSVQVKDWQERFGRSFYHFVYRDVLFLMLNSDDIGEDQAKGSISPEQVEYVRKTLEQCKNRWTFVFLHKPLWAMATADQSRWNEVEKLLDGRQYTVFAGHVHRYQKFVRNGQNYYQLATTGGGSKLRGIDYGEFDHIVWVTVKKEGPVLANILLDGILPENLKPYVSTEEGVTYFNRKQPTPVSGTVILDGAPVPGAYVEFWTVPDPKGKSTRIGDAYAEGDGTFRLSSYNAWDGAPAGDYVVTVLNRVPRFEKSGKPGPNLLPEKYAKLATTDLKVTVKAGEPNEVTLTLSK